jgi:hypothetical protein
MSCQETGRIHLNLDFWLFLKTRGFFLSLAVKNQLGPSSISLFTWTRVWNCCAACYSPPYSLLPHHRGPRLHSTYHCSAAIALLWVGPSVSEISLITKFLTQRNMKVPEMSVASNYLSHLGDNVKCKIPLVKFDPMAVSI